MPNGLIAALIAAALALPALAAPPRYTMLDLGVDPNKRVDYISGINNSGGVAATAFDGGAWPTIFSADSPRVELSSYRDNANYPYGWAMDVNNAGVAAGGASISDWEFRAMTWTEDGAGTILPSLAGIRGSRADGINDSGWAVGRSMFAEGPGELISHATLWRDGAVIDLGTPGGTRSWAMDINSSGLIVGTVDNGPYAFDPYSLAVLWKDGTSVELGYGFANAINDAGWIAGMSDNQAVLWRDGATMDLSLPGWYQSMATGINNAGDVLGLYSLPGEVATFHAFLHTNGVTYDARSLLEEGNAFARVEVGEEINDSGEFGGYVYNEDGSRRPVLFRPVPEPSAAGLGLLGLVAGSGMCFRRRRSPAA